MYEVRTRSLSKVIAFYNFLAFLAIYSENQIHSTFFTILFFVGMLSTMSLSIGSLGKKETITFDMLLDRYMAYQRIWQNISPSISKTG